MTYDVELRTYVIQHSAFNILHSALRGPARPLPEFTLHDFNKIASGEYNAGQIDFATGDNGRVSLAKINNHVHKRGLNKTTLSAARILEVKEAFVSALRRGGVSDADIAAIRARLGIPAALMARPPSGSSSPARAIALLVAGFARCWANSTNFLN